MQRRDFSRSFLALGATSAVGALAGLSALPVHAQAPVAGLKEGTDYIRLSRQAPVDSPPPQIEVLEFFAYTCIHCFNFEPIFNDWIKQKPANVVVRRTPVAFTDAFLPLQRLYYAFEAMGLVDTLHEKTFRAIHVEKLRLTTPEAITDWVVKQGVDRTKFTDFYNSFAVSGKARRATQQQEAYQVAGTPALGVGGRYYISGQGPRTLVVANALIASMRKT
jgi:thiol:disulfide interchange protein DsbA